MLSIGSLSDRTGVKVPTIRYYESIGLLPQAGRSAGNQRRYGKAETDRLTFIRHARDLGLSIGDIRELIDLSGHPDMPCKGADRIARNHLAAVRERIARLQGLATELERMVARCEGQSVGECRVLQALADHALCEHKH